MVKLVLKRNGEDYEINDLTFDELVEFLYPPPIKNESLLVDMDRFNNVIRKLLHSPASPMSTFFKPKV